MKIVKEDMNEKFTEKSDPVTDMGIGVLSTLKPLSILRCKKRIKPRLSYTGAKFYIEPGYYSAIKQIHIDDENIVLQLGTYEKYPKFLKLADLEFMGGEYLTLTKDQFFEHFEIADKNTLQEKFAEVSDPVEDLGIGSKTIFNSLKDGDILHITQSINKDHPKDSYVVIDQFERSNIKDEIRFNYYDYPNKKALVADPYRKTKNYHGAGWIISYQFFKDNMRKVLPEELNEKFSEYSDPIKDMGIGIEYEVEKFVRSKFVKDAEVVKDPWYKMFVCVDWQKPEYVEYLLARYYYPKEKIWDFIRHNNEKTPPNKEILQLLNDYYAKLDEKFEEKGDPIKDMGIGIEYKFKKWLKDFQRIWPQIDVTIPTKQLIACAIDNKPEFVEYLLSLDASIDYDECIAFRTAVWYDHPEVAKELIKQGVDVEKAKSWAAFHGHSQVLNGINKLKHVNEKFEEEGSDPLHDMGIGLKKVVIDWLNRYNNVKINEDDISINKDGEISSSKYLLFMHAPNFPDYIKFNYIRGDFLMHHNEKFTSLKGFPKHITGNLKFYYNGIKPTEEEIKKICQVDGEIQLVDDYQFNQMKSREKYKKLGTVQSRPSPIINYKDPKSPMYDQKYSRGYLLWKILEFIKKAGKEGRRYSEIVKFDSNFKKLTTPRRTLSTGVFNTTKKYTDRNIRNLYHRYVLNQFGENYLEEYRKAFDDGIDYSKGPVQESLDEKFTEVGDPIKDMGIGKQEIIKKWFVESFAASEEQFDQYVRFDKRGRMNLVRSGLKVTKNAIINGELPEYINFGTVDGDFDISKCALTSLRGVPAVVKGSFNCSYNELTSLDHAPKKVIGAFDCRHNADTFYEADIRKIVDVGGLVHDW